MIRSLHIPSKIVHKNTTLLYSNIPFRTWQMCCGNFMNQINQVAYFECNLNLVLKKKSLTNCMRYVKGH